MTWVGHPRAQRSSKKRDYQNAATENRSQTAFVFSELESHHNAQLASDHNGRRTAPQCQPGQDALHGDEVLTSEERLLS